MTRLLISLLTFPLVILVFCTTAAQATNYTWTDPGGGSFYDMSNWDPTGWPNGYDDVAIFNLPNTYTVDMPSDSQSERFEVRAGTVTLDMDDKDTDYWLQRTDSRDPAAEIGLTAGSPATLSINCSDVFGRGAVHAIGTLQIARDSGSSGQLVLNNTAWLTSSSTVVGVGGAGEFNLYDSYCENGSFYLGYNGGSSGTAYLGTWSTWKNLGSLTIGHDGTGSLTLGGLDCNLSNDDDANIAANGGSMGTVIVNDGEWENKTSLYVGGTSTGAGGTGTLTTNDGTVEVTGETKVWSGGTVNLAGGTLRTGSLTGSGGAWNWTGGTLEITGGGLSIDNGETVGSSMTVGSGQSLSLAGALAVGPTFAGTLYVNTGGTITSPSGVVGSTEVSSIAAIVIMQGSGADWTMTGDLTVRGHNSTDLVVASGASLSNANALVAATVGTTADIGLSDANSQWNSSGSVYLGGDAATAGGSGTLDVVAGAAVNVTGTLKVYENFSVTVNASTVAASVLDLAGNIVGENLGTVDLSSGTASIHGGGSLGATVTGNAATQITLQDSGSSWSMSGPLEIATTSSGSGHIGTLTLGPDTSVTATDTIDVLDNNALTLGGGALSAPLIQLADNAFEDSGALSGDVKAAGDVIATGNLTIGDPASYTGVQIEGSLVVGSHTVTINKAGFFNIGVFTDISGGTLNVPGGVAIPVGNSVLAFGTINGRLAAQSGSTVDATGNLSLGDATSPAGFFSDGELLVRNHTVTIHDANQAVLGSLTTLGEGVNPGTLVAANGAVIEFGKNLTGYGTVDTPDDAARPLVSNGSIAGESETNRITLSGYVKGVGTCTNVTFAGTYSPGFSPAEVTLGSIEFAETSTLVIELGGTTAGSEYDLLNASGSVELDGVLDVVLIDGFVPELGDTFQVMTFPSVSGDFAQYQGLAVGSGLYLRPSLSSSSLILSLCQPGDLNGDGFVGGADLDIVRSFWGQTVTPGNLLHGDPSGDGFVAGDDLDEVRAHWGEGTPPAADAVPEPTFWSMLLGLGLARAIRRRRTGRYVPRHHRRPLSR